jgi:hypothetical protein
MAYSFRAASTNGNASGGSLVVSKPTGTVDGDLVVVVAYLESDTNTWSAIGSGFTEDTGAAIANTGALNMRFYWKIASGEGASWTWTPTTNAWRTVHAAAFSGATGAGATRVDVRGAGSQADGVIETSQTAPSVTPTVAGDLLIFGYGNFSGNTASSLVGAATGLRANVGGVIIGSNEAATTSPTGTTRPVSIGTNDYAANHVAFFLDTGGGGGSNRVKPAMLGGKVIGPDNGAIAIWG